MCKNDLKDQFHQETGQDQVNNQDTTQETLQATDQEQQVDQNQNSTQEQTIEQVFKDKNVGISTLNLIINNMSKQEETASQEEGIIQGRVLDASNNSPLAKKRIDVFFSSTAGYPVASLYTNETGSYKISDLPSGFYTLRVYNNDDDSLTPTDMVNVKVNIRKPTTQDILISQPTYSHSRVRF